MLRLELGLAPRSPPDWLASQAGWRNWATNLPKSLLNLLKVLTIISRGCMGVHLIGEDDLQKLLSNYTLERGLGGQGRFEIPDRQIELCHNPPTKPRLRFWKRREGRSGRPSFWKTSIARIETAAVCLGASAAGREDL
jgi:hypothetical protein